MRILALDTATENCSAALLIDTDLRLREVETERGHADRILLMIDDLLAEAAIGLSDLDAIAFGRGPGSFTGVRLGVTVTQGLAFGAGLGVVPVSDLQAVAQRALAADASLERVLVCNDARMSEVYWGCFERDDQGLAKPQSDEHVGKPGDVRLPVPWSDATGVGRGFAAYGEALRAAVPTVEVSADRAALLPRASEIALLAAPAVIAGRLLPPEAATPIYLRDNVAQVAPTAKSLP